MKQITRHVSGDAGCMYACSRAAARTDPVLRGRARPKLVNSKTGTLPVSFNNGNLLKRAPLSPLGGDLMLSTAAPTQFVTALCVGASVVHVKVFSSRS